jgi:signal transduction histidine kinase
MFDQANGEPYIFMFSGMLILNLFVAFIFYFVVLYRRKQKEHKEEKRKMADDFENLQLVARLEIQEQTFKNISQEIHDNIGQALTLAKLNLSNLELADTPVDRGQIRITKELVSKSIADLRDLSRSLNADYITRVGLSSAISQELSLIEKLAGYKTRLSLDGKEVSIDHDRLLIVFRMVQEILNNIVKHAEASKIDVDLAYTTRTLSVIVNDNGKGFVPDNQKFGLDGQGLSNLFSRAKALDASLSYLRLDPCGTSVQLVVEYTSTRR